MIDAGNAGAIVVTMTSASHENVVDLLSESAEGTATAMNEVENVCDARPNLPTETLYHAVYIPLEHREPSGGKGNSIVRWYDLCHDYN